MFKYIAGALAGLIFSAFALAYAQPGANSGNWGIIEDLNLLGGGTVTDNIDMDDGTTTGPELQFSDGSNLRLRIGTVGAFVLFGSTNTFTFAADIDSATSSSTWDFRVNSFTTGGGSRVLRINETNKEIEGGSSTKLQLDTDGSLKILPNDETATLTLTAADGIGWSIQTGADTACNTTCTSPCVAGFATGGTLVSCSDATADSCICGGGS